MYEFLEFIEKISEELETKSKKYQEEIEKFSTSRLKDKEHIENEKKISIQSNNDYFNFELEKLQEEKKRHFDSLDKLKLELSVFIPQENEYSENINDKNEYDKNDFATNIKKIHDLIVYLKSNNSSKDNGLFSKVFRNQNSSSFNTDLLSRIMFGLNYLKNKDLIYYEHKLTDLEKRRKLEIENINEKYNQLLSENLKVSFNTKISIDDNVYNEIIRRNEIVSRQARSSEFAILLPFYYEFDYSNYNEFIINDIEQRLNKLIDYDRKSFKIPFIQDKDIFFINYNFQNNVLFTFLENLQSSFLLHANVGEYDILDFGFNVNRSISNNFFIINNILDEFVVKVRDNTQLIGLINANTNRKKVIYIDSSATSIREILELVNNVNLEKTLLVILNDISKNKVTSEQLVNSNKNIFTISVENNLYSGDYQLRLFPKKNGKFIEKIKNEYQEYSEKKSIISVELINTLKELNSIRNKKILMNYIRNLVGKRSAYFSRALSVEKVRNYDVNGIYIGDYIYNDKFISSEFKNLIVSQLSTGINSYNIHIPFFRNPINKGLNFFISGNNPSEFIKSIVLSTMEYFPINGIEYFFYNDLASDLNIDFFLENKNSLEGTFKFIFSKEDFHKNLELFLKEGQQIIEKGNDFSNKNFIEILKNNPSRAKKIKYVIINNFDIINDSRIEELLTKCIVHSDKFGIYFLVHSNSRDSLKNIINSRFHVSKEDKKILHDEYNIPIYFKKFSETNVKAFLQNYQKEIKVIENESFGFNNIMPPITRLFKNSTKNNISIPVGKNEKGLVQSFVIGDGSYHALISGATGSGKTVFLHTLIMSVLFNFNSDEINLYLLDFKGGTEFKIYDNYLLPQIKVLALDAMQEFGESILENIISLMEERSRLFKKVGVSKYSDYINKGNKLPRLLIIIDEFQILYNLTSNRKIANSSAELTKRIVTEGRSFGIHLIMSTQSTKIVNELSLSSGTIEQMRIRLGLKLTESDSNYMFGVDNSSIALGKMKGPIGTAVYTKEFMEEKPEAFRVAYIPTDIQNRFLHYISSNLIHEYREKTLVFEGEKVPEVSDLLETIDTLFLNTTIFLGERIRISPPLFIECLPKKNNNLIIAGENEKILEKLTRLVLFSVNISISGEIYFFDEEGIFIQNNKEFLIDCNHKRINFSSESESFERYINAIFSMYNTRKRNRENSEDIFLFAYNVHFSETFQEILKGDFIESIQNSIKEKEEFDFFSTANKYLSYEEDSIDINENENLSIKEKLSLIIKEGYKYNIYTIISLNNWSFYYDNLFDFRNSFKNKIIYSLSENDAEKFIPDIDISQLRENMAIYTDGMREKSQFKPYLIPDQVDFESLVSKMRSKIYGK